MTAYVLFATFLLLAIAAYYFSNQDLLSPAVLFTAPFAVASLNLLFNINRWSVNLSFNTYVTIICGTICFLLGCIVVNSMKQQRKRSLLSSQNEDGTVTAVGMNYTILFLWLLIQVVFFIISLRAICAVAARNGYTGNVFEKIGGYKRLSTHSTVDVSLGTITNVMYSICSNAGYVWIYLLIRNYFANKKIDWLLVVNLLFTFAFDLSKGGRQSLIQLLTAGMVFFLRFYRIKNPRKPLPIKTIVILALVAVLIVCSFQMLGNFLGRNSTVDLDHYIAIYLSAPIHNLDAYLKNPHNEADFFGKMTFINFYKYFGKKFDIERWNYVLDLPYLRPNGLSSGNVYTTFYAYVYDFDFVGVIILSFLMGILSQLAYNCTRKHKNTMEYAVLIYGYLSYVIAFSFFSNKFYEVAANPYTINKLRDWLIVILPLTKIRFRVGNYKLK